MVSSISPLRTHFFGEVDGKGLCTFGGSDFVYRGDCQHAALCAQEKKDKAAAAAAKVAEEKAAAAAAVKVAEEKAAAAAAAAAADKLAAKATATTIVTKKQVHACEKDFKKARNTHRDLRKALLNALKGKGN